jgi:hypothetical protein
MKRLLAGLFLLLALAPPASAQHLWWSAETRGGRIERMTFLYGEIEVLASGPDIYFCGINWRPGEPAGGYCGIQQPATNPRKTIFSVWDTSAALHPALVQADSRTVHDRFGGEGTGEHTHLNYPWENGKLFRFAVTKQPDKSGRNTLVTYYFFDDPLKKWVLEATISCPTDGKDSVRYFGGGMNSFLENWSGKSKEIPKLCLYRLWAGSAPDQLFFLRKGGGDGLWGILNDCFYLAQGSDASAVDALIARQPKSKDSTIGFIKGGKGALAIPDRPLPAEVLAELGALPQPNPPPEQWTRPQK